ncbi:MAG: hypothetical protein RLZZ196_196 [Bacteroidota bacterium]|jgi:hypothetical protein
MADYQLYLNEYSKIGKTPDAVIRYKNFMSKKDLKLFNDYMITQSPGQVFLEGPLLEKIQQYDKKIYKIISEKYGVYGVTFDHSPVLSFCLRKWGKDQIDLMPHTDGETQDGKPAISSGFYRNNVTAICYLTDEYLGGEIFFPEFDLDIKPEAGEVVMFLGNYWHGVRPILDGARNTMMSFYRFDVEDDYVPVPVVGDPSSLNFN